MYKNTHTSTPHSSPLGLPPHLCSSPRYAYPFSHSRDRHHLYVYLASFFPALRSSFPTHTNPSPHKQHDRPLALPIPYIPPRAPSAIHPLPPLHPQNLLRRYNSTPRALRTPGNTRSPSTAEKHGVQYFPITRFAPGDGR